MESIFLACFIFGALFTLASIALGFAGHGAAHIGHGAHVGGDLGHGAAHVGHGPAHMDHGGAHLNHGAAQTNHGVHGEIPHSSEANSLTSLPWLNASSVV